MKNKCKCEKGFTMVDVSIAMFVVVLFVSIVTSITYSIYTSSTEARRRAKAVNYSVAILEKVGQMPYSSLDGAEVLKVISEIKNPTTSGQVTTGYIGESETNYQFKFTLTISEEYDGEIKKADLKISYRVKAGDDGLKTMVFNRLKINERYSA